MSRERGYPKVAYGGSPKPGGDVVDAEGAPGAAVVAAGDRPVPVDGRRSPAGGQGAGRWPAGGMVGHPVPPIPGRAAMT